MSNALPRTAIRILPAFALAVLAPRLALAEEPYPDLPPPDPRPLQVAAPAAPKPEAKKKDEDDSLVNLIRGDFTLMYLRGSKRVGHGTRAYYQGASGSLTGDFVYFPFRYVGMEMRVRGSVYSTPSVGSDFEVDAALAVAPVQWRSRVSGSLTLGVGGGLEVTGDYRNWMNEHARGFPVALARLRLLPARRVMVQAQYRVLPVTTGRNLQDPLEEHFHRLELSAAIKYVHFGARAEISDVTGGTPARMYRQNAFGLFAGGGLF